jgi:hypothetical protein
LRNAVQLAREYGVVVRFVDFGDGGVDLRAEYDPTVPEIRINLRTAQSLPEAEREQFLQRAVGHELYHHREHLGEIPILRDRAQREVAADTYANVFIAESMKPKAVLGNGEILWSYDDAREALYQLAAECQVVFGFDIVELVNGAVRVWGSSSYDLAADLAASPAQRVARGVELALRDIERIRELTGLEPPYGDLHVIFVTEEVKAGMP